MKGFAQLLKNKLAIVLLVIVIILAGVIGFLATSRSANLVVIAEQQGVIAEQKTELGALKEEVTEKASEIAGLNAELASRETNVLTFTPGLKVWDILADSVLEVVYGKVQNTSDYYFETVKIIVVSYFFGGLIEDCNVVTVKGLYPGEEATWQSSPLAGVGVYREIYAIADKPEGG